MRFLKTRIVVLGLAAMFLSLPGRAQEKFILHVKSSEQVDMPMGTTPAWGYLVLAESETTRYHLTCLFQMGPDPTINLYKVITTKECGAPQLGEYWVKESVPGARLDFLNRDTGETVVSFVIEKQEQIPAPRRTQPRGPTLYKWICPVHPDFVAWTKSGVAQLQHKPCGRTLVSRGTE